MLAEIPEDWAAQVAGWHDRAVELSGGAMPEPDTEYLLWQTLAGAWPLDTGRLAGYLRKAMREAKTATSWTDPDEDYEAAVLRLADRVLGDGELSRAIAGFVTGLAADARVNSLGMKLVQLTMPGVADVYQGCELAGLSLVDPDNRRPVDFGHRRQLLAALDAGEAAAGLDAEKLLVTSAALRLRRRHPDWFTGGLPAAGRRGPRGGSCRGVRPRRPGGDRGDPAAGRAARPGRLGRHRADVAWAIRWRGGARRRRVPSEPAIRGGLRGVAPPGQHGGARRRRVPSEPAIRGGFRGVAPRARMAGSAHRDRASGPAGAAGRAGPAPPGGPAGPGRPSRHHRGCRR